jgi:hypothetical protein
MTRNSDHPFDAKKWKQDYNRAYYARKKGETQPPPEPSPQEGSSMTSPIIAKVLSDRLTRRR